MRENIHISLIIIMISLALFCSYHIYYHFISKESKELVEVYYQNSDDNNTLVTKMDNKEEEYLGILKIPKINLEEGFYQVSSKNNNVSKSVTILKESILPDNNNSIVYLVAHSGTGYLAFFKDLKKLSVDDILYLDINNNNYKYVINDIYEVDKGTIVINHNIHDDYLVLSTCSGNKQLVITSKLVKNYS